MEIEIDDHGTAGKVFSRMTGLRDQMPYVTMLAVNDTAKEVQREEIINLKAKLLIRTNWYMPGKKLGINRTFATIGNPTAKIYTTAKFMELQEFGGMKMPKNKTLPISNKPNLGMEKMTPFRQKDARLPRGLKTKKNVFFGMAGFGHKTLGIWQRTPNNALKLLYNLVSKAHIKPALRFVQTGKETVNRIYEAAFSARLKSAIANAKFKK